MPPRALSLSRNPPFLQIMSHDTRSTGNRAVSSPFTASAPAAPAWKWLGVSPVSACHSACVTGYLASQNPFDV